MKLFYFHCPYGNFGDDLNLWFWDQVLPGWQGWDGETHLIGIGSILTRHILPPGRKLVLGTGSGYGALPDISGPDWDIRGVRGPLTCERLGLSAEMALSDPAILLPEFDRFHDVAKTSETLFVPHINSDLFCDWERLCTAQGIAYQSPSAPFEEVITRIAGAERVIAESMHAAIIADAFGVPWRAVAISNNFNLFKWQDWAASLDIDDLAPQHFFAPLRKLQGMVRTMKTRLGAQRRKGSATPEARGRTANAQNGHRSGRKGYLELFAPADLKRARDGRFRLSDRAALVRQQQKLRAVLEQTRHDYTPRERGYEVG